MNYNFDENEMPYDILERFGLTQAMIDDLPTDVLQNIHNGRKSPVLPVHITADDEEQTIGIDLNSNTGIVWKREAKRDWDKFNFGIFGCWTMDENGNLDYIPEENYTEEMWNEQKKLGMRMMQR